jgi:hypothetical protein
VKSDNHYIVASSVSNQYWSEYLNGTVLFTYHFIRQEESQVTLFDSSRNAYIRLGPENSQYSLSNNTGFFTIYNGTWISSKCQK